MGIYVIPQPVGRPPYISGPKHRSIIYVGFQHTVTAEEAGYFELWLPYVDGHPEPHHVIVHQASVEYDANLIGAVRGGWVWLQDETEQIRIALTSLGWQAGIYTHGEFINTHGSRGILTFADCVSGMNIKVNYLLEMI